MRTGISITDLARRIEANRELKHDLIADTRTTTVEVQDDGVVALAVDGQVASFPIGPIAHDQIGAHTNIPARYYDRMRGGSPDDRRLLAANINHWFTNQPARRMIRTLGGDMRSFHSDRFRRIEHEDIANAALPVLATVPGLKIVSCEMTERRMYIQAVTDRIAAEVKRGDVVQAGVVISNSEVGLGSVSIRPIMYRLICLNGAVLEDGNFRAYHVGRRIADTDELVAMWADDTKRADDHATLLKVRDTVSGALSEARFAQAVERARALTGEKLKDPIRAVEVLSKRVNASEGEQRNILRNLIEGGDLSAWGLVNAVTAQAHTTENYDRAFEHQHVGGALLSLPAGAWREIVTAE